LISHRLLICKVVFVKRNSFRWDDFSPETEGIPFYVDCVNPTLQFSCRHPQLYARPLSLDLIHIKDALDWVGRIQWLFHLQQESRDEFVFMPTF
jgi:hypothetical protein